MSPAIARLQTVIQPYAWGSRRLMAELMGRPAPSPAPMAELWMGAHPKAPSRIETPAGPVGLDTLIAADPAAWLGPRVAARFGGTLPFLFKILAADEALSIQAHPSLLQAAAGFARDNAAGLDPAAPNRNYRDANHKPEVLCALTPFTAMKGCRLLSDVRRAMGPLAAAGAPFTAPLSGADQKAMIGRLLALPAATQATVVDLALAQVDAALAAADTLAATDAAAADRDRLAWRWVRRLAAQYPGDIGCLAPLFLNVLELAPGDAIYTEAGDLHAYLDGMGVELMANSDNVLRGGLTVKHIDVPELMRVMTVTVGIPPILRPRTGPTPADVGVYPSPVSEFSLRRVELDGSDATWTSPASDTLRLVLCTRGTCTLRPAGTAADAADAITLRPGDSAVVPAAVPSYSASGDGQLFEAATP